MSESNLATLNLPRKRIAKAIKSAETKAPRELTAKQKAAIKRQRYAGYGMGVVALALVVMSLTHLAHGIQAVTGCVSADAWCLAVGIDLGFVSLEIAQLFVASVPARAVVERLAVWAIAGTVVVSMAMNALAFAELSTWFYGIPAALLGAAIPVLVYVLTKIAVAMSTK